MEISRPRQQPSRKIGESFCPKLTSNLGKARSLISRRVAVLIDSIMGEQSPSLQLPSSTVIAQSAANEDQIKFHQLAHAAEAMVRQKGFGAAITIFDEISRELQACPTLKFPQSFRIVGHPSRNFCLARPNSTARLKDQPMRVAVYTSLFGNYDRLPPVLTEARNIEFLCFSDQDIEVRGWRTIRSEALYESSALSAKYFKLQPHKVLPNFDASLFIDANTVLCGDLESFLERWLLSTDFAMWPHPERDCIHDEALTIMYARKSDPLEVAKQLERYEDLGLELRRGFFEGSFIWRKHNKPEVIKFDDRWWQEVLTYTSRDQVSLYFLLQRESLGIRSLPEGLGTSRNNVIFSKIPHRPRRPLASPHGTRALQEVCFLFDQKMQNGSMPMALDRRFVDILNHRTPENISVRVSSHTGSVNGGLVIVTGGMIGRLSEADMREIRRAGAVVAVDFLDAKLNDIDFENFDLVIAASMGGYLHCSKKYDLPIFHMTHYSPTGMVAGNLPNDCLRLACFGEKSDVFGSDYLSRVVDFFSLSAEDLDTPWRHRLSEYNGHFALTKRGRDMGRFLPFTKGFLAAECGAAIFCSREDGDAIFYLGDDYPYFINATEPKDVEYQILSHSEGFGGADWHRAMHRMASVRARSSPDFIAQEFTDILKNVL